jgi:hypothetical protein
MSSLVLEGRETVGSCIITTRDRQFGPDGPNKLKLTKTSQVEFKDVVGSIQHDLKIAFQVKGNQDVESLEVLSQPALRPQKDPDTARDAETVFGSDGGTDKWVGWRIPYVGPWPPVLETKMVLRKFNSNLKHIQLIPIMFTFAVDAAGNDFDKHALPAASTCLGSGHSLQIETRTVFIP